MAVMELWRRRDLEGTAKPEYIDGNFFTQDSVGNLVGVKVYKDGAEVSLTGSVTGYCVLPSGETVSVAGTRSGNQASILVPQSALAYTGPLGITLKLVDGNTITTLMSIIVVVYRSKTDTVITPSSQIITDWANQISAALQEVEDASAAQDEKIDDLKSAIVNYSASEVHFTNAGSGYINAANPDHGVEPSTTFDHTGYIDVTLYKTLAYRISKHTIADPSVGMVFYDANKARICGYVGLANQSEIGYYVSMSEVIVPSNAVYARFSFYHNTATYGDFKIVGKTLSGMALDSIDAASGTLIKDSLIQGTASSLGIAPTPRVIRTGLIPVRSGQKVSFVAGEANAKEMLISAFDDSFNFISDYGWYGSTDFDIETDEYIVICFRRGDGTDINPSQYDAKTVIKTQAQSEIDAVVEYTKGVSDDVTHAEKTITRKSYLYLGTATRNTGHNHLLRNTVQVSFLIEAYPNTVYEIRRIGSSARFRIGGVNSLTVTDEESTSPIGEILYHNDNGTKAIINSKNWKYLIVQCATSTDTALPVITAKTYFAGYDYVPVSDSFFYQFDIVSKYFNAWDTLFVNSGSTPKYGKNNVCYKQTIATVHDLPVNAYMFSFGTKRMLDGAAYRLRDEAPGSIAFGDYMDYGTKKKIMLTSGMHGDERATPSALMQWMYNLCYNPKYKKYQCFDYYVIPICNPTGYDANTRNNINGVNINRDAVNKASAEGKAIAEFIAQQHYLMFFDFHQCYTSWESTSLPLYGFVSQANDTPVNTMDAVNKGLFKAIAKTDQALNSYFEKTEAPQGGFVWEGSPESESPGTFRNYGIRYADISCTFETSQRCPYYANGMDWYSSPAMVCNQTFFDNVMAEMMFLLGVE